MQEDGAIVFADERKREGSFGSNLHDIITIVYEYKSSANVYTGQTPMGYGTCI